MRAHFSASKEAKKSIYSSQFHSLPERHKLREKNMLKYLESGRKDAGSRSSSYEVKNVMGTSAKIPSSDGYSGDLLAEKDFQSYSAHCRGRGLSSSSASRVFQKALAVLFILIHSYSVVGHEDGTAGSYNDGKHSKIEEYFISKCFFLSSDCYLI